ncbi:MAG TPA: hypothetical protein VII73_06585 [Caulobacteraceae bacterium]
MIRALCLACVISVIGAASADAQEVIATAIGVHDAPDASSIPSPKPLNQDRPAYDDRGAPLVMGACGPTAPVKNGDTADHKAHGEIEAGVGTGGYRHVAGVVCQPIGDNAAVTIAAGQTQWRNGRGR